MKRMKQFWLAGAILIGLIRVVAAAMPVSGPWDQPAASLAEQIAEILGPGQARLTIRNLSTLPTEQIPAIRRLLEQNLKAHGVLASGAESANFIRVTLSENARERLWVAEVLEGNETRVAMVRVEPGAARQPQTESGLTLRKQAVLTSSDEVLAAFETASGLVAIEPEQVVIYGHAEAGWRVQKKTGIGQTRPFPRDPRGEILPSADGTGFEAWVAGMVCSGSSQSPGEWIVRCHESDDPWPITQGTHPQPATASNSASLKAFYNPARNYFTGVVTSGLGVDLPAFSSAALLPRADGVVLLINGVDGKVQIVTNGVLRSVSGTRDWGSDFAALNTGCGAGTQIVASGSGEAATDSLRAYELPGQEAIPASAPLAMDGTVTALWTAPEAKSLFAVVRSAANKYEVDRVTASCN
jgi:hypothetical protein